MADRQDTETKAAKQEAEANKLIQEVIKQVLHYKPRDPLEFTMQYLDEQVGESTPQLSAFYRLQLTRDDPELFLEELSNAYGVFAAKRKAHCICGNDVERITRAFCMEMPVRYEKILVLAARELCAAEEACEFEKFCACMRIAASCYGVFHDAYRLWEGLGDASILVVKRQDNDSEDASLPLKIPEAAFEVIDLLAPLRTEEDSQEYTGLFALLRPFKLATAIRRLAPDDESKLLTFTQILDSVLEDAPQRLLSLHSELAKLCLAQPISSVGVLPQATTRRGSMPQK